MSGCIIRPKFLEFEGQNSYLDEDKPFTKEQVQELSKMQEIFKWFVAYDKSKKTLKNEDVIFFTEGRAPVPTSITPWIEGSPPDAFGSPAEGILFFSLIV